MHGFKPFYMRLALHLSVSESLLHVVFCRTLSTILYEVSSVSRAHKPTVNMDQPRSTSPALETVSLKDVSNYLGQSPSEQHSADGISLDTQPPEHAVSALPRWNESRANVFKTMSTFFGFLVMGANDAVYGAIIPYLQTHYGISYTVVSLIFLSPMVGYISAAAVNNILHQKVGRRGVAIIGPGSHLVAYVVISLHPPYPVLVVTFILAGFGNGVLDAAWNAWLVSHK